MAQRDAREERRRQIRDGAFEALRKYGLPHLSYDVIATEAGATRQLVRYHYPEPEDLMRDLCDMLAEIYRDALISTAGQLSGPARVDAFLDFYFDLLEGKAKPKDDQVYDAMFSLAAGSEEMREALAGQYTLVGQVLSHEFAVQYPDLDQQSAEELSYLFVALMYGHWKMVSSLGFSEDHNRLSRAAMDRLIRSYCAENSEFRGTLPVWQRKTAQD